MKLSRRKLAQYVADQLIAGADRAKLIRQLAAYVVESGSSKQTDMILADIERELAGHGFVSADVTTATPITDSVRQTVTKYVQQSTATKNTNQVSIAEHIDPSILGGIIIETPGKRLDASVRTSLTKLANH